MNNTGADKPHGGPDRHFASNTIPRMFVEDTGDSLAKRNAAAGIDRAMAGYSAELCRGGNTGLPRGVIPRGAEDNRRGRSAGGVAQPNLDYLPGETVEAWGARVAREMQEIAEAANAETARRDPGRHAAGITVRRVPAPMLPDDPKAA